MFRNEYNKSNIFLFNFGVNFVYKHKIKRYAYSIAGKREIMTMVRLNFSGTQRSCHIIFKFRRLNFCLRLFFGSHFKSKNMLNLKKRYQSNKYARKLVHDIEVISLIRIRRHAARSPGDRKSRLKAISLR